MKSALIWVLNEIEEIVVPCHTGVTGCGIRC